MGKRDTATRSTDYTNQGFPVDRNIVSGRLPGGTVVSGPLEGGNVISGGPVTIGPISNPVYSYSGGQNRDDSNLSYKQRMKNREFDKQVSSKPQFPELGLLGDSLTDFEKEDIRRQEYEAAETHPEFPELGMLGDSLTEYEKEANRRRQEEEASRHPDYPELGIIGSVRDDAVADMYEKAKPDKKKEVIPAITEALKPWKTPVERTPYESPYKFDVPTEPRQPVQRAEVNMNHISQLMGEYGPGPGQTVLSKALRAGASPVPGQMDNIKGGSNG